MKITFDNFKNLVPPRIWARGEEYFEDGAVLNIEETSAGEWVVTVEGTEDYTVEISLDGDEILSWSCDCPYDGGDVCKHVVAAVLAIREQSVDEQGYVPVPDHIQDAQIIGAAEEDTGFNDLMNLAKDRDLKDFITRYASVHSDFKTEFSEYLRSRYLCPAHQEIDYSDEVVKIFRSALKTHISHGRRHFYDYDFYIDWGDLCKKICKILNDTALLMKMGKAEPAVQATIQFFRSLDGLDDDDIFYDPPQVLADCCQKAGDLLVEASGHDSVTAERKSETIEELLDLMHSDNLNEMYDMDGLLLEINSRINPNEASLELIDRQINNMTGYRQERYVIAKIDTLRSMSKMDEARKTADKYISLTSVCNHEVEWYQSQGRFQDALRLINSAIDHARESGFTSSGWLEKRMHVHELLNDMVSVISDCRQLFICRNGSMEYYHKLKKLVPEKDWKPFLDNMLDQVAVNGIKADIYAEEKNYDQLFALIKSSDGTSRLSMLQRYAKVLPSDFGPALLEICAPDLESYAEQNMGRKYYSYVADILRTMQNLKGGKEAVQKLVSEFRKKYKIRRAMMEELAKF